MSFGGNLATMPFPDILQWLSMGNKTGTLKVTVGEQDVRMVYFKMGNVIAARTNQLKDHLGKLLLREGALTKDQLKKALAKHKTESSKPFGAICVELGFLPEDEILDLARLHSETIIYNLFSLGGGEFIFQEGDLPEEQLIPISITANDLMMRGIKLRNEWEKIHEKLGSPDLVYYVQVEADPLVLGLSPTEEEILGLVDGQRTLQQVCERSPLSDFETYKALANFLDSNYIAVVDEDDQESVSMHDHQTDILADAQALVDKGNYAEAVEAIKSLLQLFPDHAEAKKLLRQCQRGHIEDIYNTVGNDQNVPKLTVPLTDPLFQSLTLSAHEGFLLSQIDGRTSIKNLAAVTRIPMEDVYRTLYQLVVKGAVAIGSPSDSKQGTASNASRSPAAARRQSSANILRQKKK